MKIGLMEQFFMLMRRSPVGKIKKVAARAERAGFTIRPNELEAHYIAGGNIERVIDALILAKEHDVDTDYFRISSLDLAGKNPIDVVQCCTIEQQFSFHTTSQDFNESIQGTCKNGESLFAKLTIFYRNPINYAWESQIPHMQELLASEILPIINTSESSMALEVNKAEYLPSLLALAKETMETVLTIDVEFSNGRFE